MHFLSYSDINIARDKLAYQKSTIEDNGQARPASVAVNGILYGNSKEEYTHTSGGEPGKQWWMVDLEGVYDIKEIYLFNRYDSTNSKTNSKFSDQIFNMIFAHGCFL